MPPSSPSLLRLSAALSTPLQSHSHSHPAFPGSPSILLRPPRPGGRPRPDRLLAGETPRQRQPALGCDCGNGGVFPGGARLPWLSPPLTSWGSRLLKRLVEARGAQTSKKERVSPGQQKLPFAFDMRLNQIPGEWHQIAARFRRANGILDGDRERSS